MVSLTLRAVTVVCVCALVIQANLYGPEHYADGAERPDARSRAASVDRRGQASAGAGYGYVAGREYSYGQYAPGSYYYYPYGYYGSVKGFARGAAAGVAAGRGRQAGVAVGVGRGAQAGVAVGAGRGAQGGRRGQDGGDAAGGQVSGVAGRGIGGDGQRGGRRGGRRGAAGRGAAGRGAGSVRGPRRFPAPSNPSDAIAFSGNRKSSQFFFQQGPVIFDDVTTNIGGGYNKNYGVFTAFESGIYLVSYNVVSPRKGYKTAAVDLLRNKEIINSATGSGSSGETSNSAVVFLNRYDQLSVQGRGGSAIYCGDGGDDAFCSFNVALLKVGYFTDSKVARPVPGW